MRHLASVLRIEMDYNNERRASVLRKRHEEVLEGVNAARRGADGDDHRLGVFSLRYGRCLVLVIARHDTTPRVKFPAETYINCCSFASYDLTVLEPCRLTHVAAAGGLGWLAKRHGEDGLANRDVLVIGTSTGGVNARLASSSRSTYRATPARRSTRTAKPGGAPAGEPCKGGEVLQKGPHLGCPPNRHLLLDGDRC